MPRAAEPEPLLVFEGFAVARLARPTPFREPVCMPAGMPWWRRWMRQVLPDHEDRSCCWYHGGDWHTVNAMALKVLERARAQSVDPDDMEEFATAYAAGASATQWESEALATLFSIGDAIQPASGTGYINSAAHRPPSSQYRLGRRQPGRLFAQRASCCDSRPHCPAAPAT
ncbi:hypothetical protein ACWGJ2_39165 [Streptomyces sp. NPDC054796]